MLKKILVGLGLVATLAVAGCSSSSDPVLKQGPYEGYTYTQALAAEGINPPSPDYYKQVCAYLEVPGKDGILNDGEFLRLIAQVGGDTGINILAEGYGASEQAGSLVGASVLAGCPEYIPLFDRFG